MCSKSEPLKKHLKVIFTNKVYAGGWRSSVKAGGWRAPHASLAAYRDQKFSKIYFYTLYTRYTPLA